MENGNIGERIQQAVVLLAKYAKPRSDGTVWVDQPFRILTTELMVGTKQAQQIIRELIEQKFVESYYPYIKARLMTKQCGAMGVVFAVPEKADEEKEIQAPPLPVLPENGELIPTFMRPREERADKGRSADSSGKKWGRQSLPQSEIDKVIAAHAQCGGNATQASKALERSIITVIKYWKKSGLVAKGRRGASSGVSFWESGRQSSETKPEAENIEQSVGTLGCQSLPQSESGGAAEEVAGDTKTTQATGRPELRLIKTEPSIADKSAPAVSVKIQTVCVREYELADSGAIELIKQEDMDAFEVFSSKLLPLLAASYEVMDVKNRALVLRDPDRCAHLVVFGGREAELAALNQVALWYAKATLKCNEEVKEMTREKRGRLTPEEINCILDHYYSDGGEASLAAIATGFSEPTIRKYWRNNNLEPAGSRGGIYR